MKKRHKILEGLGPFVGKKVFLELRGGTPVVRSRREIALKGKVVSVDTDKQTITLEIPLEHLSTISDAPITRAQRRGEERAERA